MLDFVEYIGNFKLTLEIILKCKNIDIHVRNVFYAFHK